jgi:hypothetical protein
MVKKYKINVDLDSAREEAKHLESITIEADNEDEALDKALDEIEKNMYGGPYYNVSERNE